jgi:hypothetical protein
MEFQNFMEENHFYDLGGPEYEGWVKPYDFTEKFDKPSPAKLIQAYKENTQIRRFVDQIVNHCPEPTFVPVRNWHFVRDTFTDLELCPEAFILCHAVQILLFAPQNWCRDRVYFRDVAKYEHRFPTPDFIGGGTEKVVAGLFSMEDLHRAILLLYYLIRRRKQVNWFGKVPEDSDSELEFPGYHQPPVSQCHKYCVTCTQKV